MNADALRKLYPSLTDEELRIAGENLDAYLALAWEIYQDMQAESASSRSRKALFFGAGLFLLAPA
jgi:hypothetical protein